MRLYALVVAAASRWGVRAQRSPIQGRASHDVTVRVRGCGPHRLPFQIRNHCGGHSADGTFKKFCAEEYLELAFTQEHYKPRAGQRPDLDYVPWHCHDSLARATCAAVWKSTSATGAPDNSSPSHFSAMTRLSWLGRAARNRHRHAIEQASRRWRGGRVVTF